MAKIREVMTRDLITLEKSATCAEAARRMRDDGVGDVIVTENGNICGIITDRDIVIRAVAEGKNPSSIPLEEVCSKELQTVSPDDTEESAMEKMRAKAVRRVVVVENSKPVGIVSLGDLAQRRDPTSVLGEVSSAPPNV